MTPLTSHNTQFLLKNLFVLSKIGCLQKKNRAQYLHFWQGYGNFKFERKKLRDVLQEREVASSNKFWTILSMLNHFLYLCQSILVWINLSRPNLVQLCLSWSISIYHCPSLAILSYPGPFCTQICYFGLSRAI